MFFIKNITGDPMNDIADATSVGVRQINNNTIMPKMKIYDDSKTADLANSVLYLLKVVSGQVDCEKPEIEKLANKLTPLAESFAYMGKKLSLDDDKVKRPKFPHNDRESTIAKSIVYLTDALVHDKAANKQEFSEQDPQNQIANAINFIGDVIKDGGKKDIKVKAPDIKFDNGDAQIAKGLIAIGTYIAGTKGYENVSTHYKNAGFDNRALFPYINYNAGDEALLGAALAHTVNRSDNPKGPSVNATFEKTLKRNLKGKATPIANIANAVVGLDLRGKIQNFTNAMDCFESGVGMTRNAVKKKIAQHPFEQSLKTVLGYKGMIV